MSERRLSEIAQRLVQPEDVTSSDFKLINGAAVKAGIHYDLWQKGFLYLLFAKRSDGKYACGIRRSGPVQLQTDRQDVHRRNFDIHPVRRTRRDSGHLDRAPYAHLR